MSIVGYLKTHQKILVPATLALIIGFVVGVVAKPGGKGIFVELAGFRLGVPELKLNDIDLGSLKDDEISILIDKISEVPPETKFGMKVRDLAAQAEKGGRGKVFENIKLDEKYVFLNDDDLGKGFASVCDRSPLKGKLLIAIKDESSGKGVLTVRAVETRFEGCDSSEDTNKVWVNEKYVGGWCGDGKCPETLATSATTLWVISAK